MKNNLKVRSIYFSALLTAISLFVQFKGNAQTTGYYTILNQPCNNDGTLAIVITSGLTPPLTFNYYDGYNSFSHQNVNSLTDTLFGITGRIQHVWVSETGSNFPFYSTNINGMTLPFTVDPPAITDAICPNLTGSIYQTINGGTQPTSINWFSILPDFTAGNLVGNNNPINLPPGNYFAVIEDVNGCLVYQGLSDSISDYTINNISGITFNTTTSDANCTNGSASVTNINGGTPPYTFNWSNGSNTSSITNLISNQYSVTVTDVQGCNTSSSVFVNQLVNINVNPVITSATCLQNNGSIISFGSGGTPPYTYSYSNGMTGQTISGLQGSTLYTVTATDNNGCIGTNTAFVNTSTPISVTYNSNNSSCTSPTGSIQLSINGGVPPYSVIWNLFPVQSGITLANVPPGSYSFTVTDANGCINNGTAVVSPISMLSVSPYHLNPTCPSTNGTAGVNIIGNSPPFSYLWNTGATTQNITTSSLGIYTCTVTDAMGCTQIKSIPIEQLSPVNVSFAVTNTSCIFSNDGTVTANISGGVPPYNYIWSNGQTSSTATGISAGHHYLLITDANGCQNDYNDGHFYVGNDNTSNTCYCTITGKVFLDLNGNCLLDINETGINNIMVHCSGVGYTFTDTAGNYSFLVPSGSYTVSENILGAYPLATCQNNNIIVNASASSGCTFNVNFANTIANIHDLQLTRIFNNPVVPGTYHTQKLIISNLGTANESNNEVSFESESQINLNSISEVNFIQPNNSQYPDFWHANSLQSLSPLQSQIIYFNYQVPTNIPLGTELNFIDTISGGLPMSNWINDYSPWNNVRQNTTIVVGSYDPNMKEVSPKGEGAEGNITVNDSILEYTIHFQNTGTYYANKVEIIDTLDTDLDISSIKFIYSDHEYIASVTETGILTITFNNIHLDWQSNNEDGSKGLIVYSIRQKHNLSVGTKIKNKAAIYFDYNPPIITNETINTIAEPTEIEESIISESFYIYPNPFSDRFTINSSVGLQKIQIFDLQGRLLQSEKLNQKQEKYNFYTNNLVPGIYILEIISINNQRMTSKLVKTN